MYAILCNTGVSFPFACSAARPRCHSDFFSPTPGPTCIRQLGTDVYRKWNEKFFLECYRAYKEGRATVDPSECWYRGEIGFFDYYIIPLAKKLQNCGVFGVSW